MMKSGIDYTHKRERYGGVISSENAQVPRQKEHPHEGVSSLYGIVFWKVLRVELNKNNHIARVITFSSSV